ncbi:MAG: hypothetical protein ACXWDL_11040 [Nocardioides sp.]
MNNARTLFFVILGFILVGGGIMVAIYLLRGGEGESTDIPTNPDAAASAPWSVGP